MRFYVFGPRLFGVRPGMSFNFNATSPPRAATSARAGGFVYVIEGAHGHQKVGWSSDPEKRRRDLQTGSPVVLLIKHAAFAGLRASDVEQEAHRILDAQRLPGEWFDVSSETAVASIYAAAARLKITLNDVAAPVDDAARRWRLFVRLKWALFALGMVAMAVAIRTLAVP